MIRVFIRSARSFEELVKARKITQAHVYTEQEAIDMCEKYNSRLNARPKRKGTRMEWEKE